MTCYLSNNFLLQKCWLNKVEKYWGEEQCNVLDIIQYSNLCVSNLFFCRGWKAFFRVVITLYALLGWGSWVIKGPKIGPHVSWFWSFPTDLWNLLSYDQSCNRFQNTLLHRWCTSISLFSGYSQSDSNAYHKMTTSCISLIYNTEKLCW